MEENKEIENKNFNTEETEIHLLDYWNIIRIRLSTFIGVFLLVMTAAIIYVLVATPIYRAETILLIEPSSVSLTNIDGVYDPSSSIRDFQARQEFLTTQMELMQAEHLLSKTFTDLGFATTEEFRDSKSPIESFKDLFDISLMRKTFLVTLAFDWKDPNKAKEVSNYLAGLYVQDYKERMLGFGKSGVENLQEQLVNLKQARIDAMDALLKYKRKNKMIDLDDAHKLLVDRMTSLNEALIEARVEEVTTRSALQSIKDIKTGKDAANNFPEVFENPTITAFKLQQIKAKAEALGLLDKFSASHSKIKIQEKIFEEIGNAVDAEIQLTLSSVKVLHERAELLVELLSEGLKDLKEESFALDEKATEFRSLKDTYDAKDKVYRMVLDRINEINITQNSGKVDAGGNINIITPAKIPNKIHAPRRVRIVAIAIVLGLMLAGGTCFGLDYIDTSVKYKEELEDTLKAPVLGFMPKLGNGDPETVAVTHPKGTFAEAFRSIRTSLGLSIMGRKLKTVVVTSSIPSEGKSIASFNLAVTFAMEGKKVLLMECDMRRPRQKKLMAEALKSRTKEDGLSKVIIGEAKLEDITWSYPKMETLDIALCGHIPPNPAELLSSENFKKVLEDAKEKYDIVILDAPPVLNVTDAVILAGSQNPVVFVSRAFSTNKKQVEIAASQIKQAQGTVIGAIINNLDAPSRQSAGYYYGGYYHKYEYK